MKIAISNAVPPIGLADRYLAVNATFADPFSIRLATRGLYSEVNCLLAGMAYGLIHRRRFILDDSDFDGVRWGDLFNSTLPTAAREVIASIHPDWSALEDVPDRHRFTSIRRRVRRHYNRHLPVWNFDLGVAGGVLPVMRQLADAFCQPALQLLMPTMPAEYAALHVRRGDKIAGMNLNGVHYSPEGEDTPLSAYLTVLAERAPELRFVWVMTDDYSAVTELRNLAPWLDFETASEPSSAGYDQQTFSALSPAAKTAERQRVVAETEIAIRSSIFIGGLKSNVSRFVALRHLDHKRCISIDAQRRWYPG